MDKYFSRHRRAALSIKEFITRTALLFLLHRRIVSAAGEAASCDAGRGEPEHGGFGVDDLRYYVLRKDGERSSGEKHQHEQDVTESFDNIFEGEQDLEVIQHLTREDQDGTSTSKGAVPLAEVENNDSVEHEGCGELGFGFLSGLCDTSSTRLLTGSDQSAGVAKSIGSVLDIRTCGIPSVGVDLAGRVERAKGAVFAANAKPLWQELQAFLTHGVGRRGATVPGNIGGKDITQGHGNVKSEAGGNVEARREAIKDAIRWAWKGYKRYAWGTDELMPLSQQGKTTFGLGLTIVDSMDTLWLAGEHEEFERSVRWVKEAMDVAADRSVNVFETTIRVLGGLLSAYHLSGDSDLLQFAEALGERLAKAFDSPSGVPYSDVHLKSGYAFNPRVAQGSSLAEAGTLQLEFSYLSQVTGNPVYDEVAQKAADAIEAARLGLGWSGTDKAGLSPIYLNPESGEFESGGVGGDRVTLGARGDSYYEYLLKQWIFSGRKHSDYLDRYREAVRGIETGLLRKSYPSELVFVGELKFNKAFSPKMDHLVCFLPGTLALGFYWGAAGDEADRHISLARELMDTCYEMYARTVTGLAPEIAHFRTSRGTAAGERDLAFKSRDNHNLLRPESLESLYYLYWVTGEEEYRERGWRIFESFEKYCRVESGGYSGLQDVTDEEPKRLDKMETFFISESLKYLLLLFSDRNPLPFDDYVLNTEAHPFPIRTPDVLSS